MSKLIRNTYAGWVSSNPIIALGDTGFERDTGRSKIGDGVKTWNDLNYFNGTSGSGGGGGFIRNTYAGWVSSNPVLALGDTGFERDTGRFKIGDGVKAWNDLKYYNDTSASAPVGGGSDPRVLGIEDFADTTFDPIFAFTYSGTPWALASDAGMFTGVSSLKSSSTPDNGQTSCFVGFTIPSGKIGVFTAMVRASSERNDLDFLRVYRGAQYLGMVGDNFNGSNQITYPGVGGNPSPWVMLSHRCLAGAHSLEFRYRKDGSVAAGFDAAYIDSLAVLLHDV
jgi:hypothetical protein